MKVQGWGSAFAVLKNLFPCNSVRTGIAESGRWRNMQNYACSFVFVVLIETNRTLSAQKLHIVNLVFVSL